MLSRLELLFRAVIFMMAAVSLIYSFLTLMNYKFITIMINQGISQSQISQQSRGANHRIILGVVMQEVCTPPRLMELGQMLNLMANAASIAAAFGGGLPPGISGTNERCTVLVSNLNPDRIDEDKLVNLFSLYGNIVRIKLLRKKPDHALVLMGNGFQAELAVHFLKRAMLFGKRLKVSFSKHPKLSQGADTHEYVNSNLNRFYPNAAKNYRHCCSPTKMVHLSTLPLDVTEEEIVNHLAEHGTIVNTKLFEMKAKKQALVLFETEEEATEALVSKHATSLGGSIIRISFSQLKTIRENSQ